MPRPSLTILTATRNGARNLERILPNLRAVADDLVVAIDSLSTDDSAEVARRFADKVIDLPHEAVFPDGSGPDPKDILLPHCRGDWVLRLDHDETLGPEWSDEGLIESILSDRWATHAFVPRRWAVEDGQRYLSGRHWLPSGAMRLFRNLPSLIRTMRVLHGAVRVAGEGRYLAEAYLVHWVNAWASREERVERVKFYATMAPYTSHEFYLYELQPHETRPLYEPLPDPRFEVAYARSSDARFRAAIRVFEAPEAMIAGDVAPVLLGLHNGSPRPLHPDSDMVCASEFAFTQHWWKKGAGKAEEPVVFGGERWPLPRRVAPGEYALAWMRLRAPREPGEYRVQLDLIEEGASWFSQHVEMPSLTVAVSPQPAGEWYPDLPPNLRLQMPGPEPN